MTTIVLRSSKGSALLSTEVDANFTNLNTDKAEINSPTFTGNVGIGTSSPSYKLDVGNFSTASTQTIRVAAAANNDSQIKLMEAADSYGFTIRNVGASGLNILRHSGDATGATALFIDRGTGNVGIGTSSPQALLDLGGGTLGKGISWNSSSTSSYGNIYTSYTNAQLVIAQGLKGSTTVAGGFQSANSATWAKSAIKLDYGVISFYSNPPDTVTYGTAYTPAERMRIDSSGKVGINVTPVAGTNAKLQITGLATNATTLATAYSDASLVVVPKSTSGYSLAIASGTYDCPQLQVSVNGAASGDLLIQPYGGNVGIGTSSPSTYANGYAPVLAVGVGVNYAIIQGRTDGPTGATNGVSFGGSYSTNPINGSRMTLNAEGVSGQRGSISFWTKVLDDNSTQPIERMRINTSGNVGIGASSPVRKLHVASVPDGGGVSVSGNAPNISITNADTEPNTNTMASIFALATAAGNYGLNAGEAAWLGLGASRGNFVINPNYSGAGTKDIILQPSSGNVGIGTSNPSSKLDVYGGYISTANTQLAIGNILSTTAALVAGNWYRIATFSASNQAQTADITVRNGGTHNNTIIKVAKGTGQWRAEVYRAGYYVNPPSNLNYPAINKVRIYDIGVNNVTHIDIQILGNTVSQTYNVIVKNNISDVPTNRLTLVALTDQGTTAAGVEFQSIGTMASWGNNNGQLVTFDESGNVGATSFSGAGTGLTGTASSFTVGNSTTVTTVTASNLAGAVAPGTSGNLLTSNGTSWTSGSPPTPLPSQTGNSGKYLTTDATNTSWVDAAAVTEVLTNKTITQPILKAYKETIYSLGSVTTATVDIDTSLANIFDLTLTASTTATFTNVVGSGYARPITLIVRQPASAAGKTLTVTSAKYTDGAAPVLSTGVNQIDVLTFWSPNGGTTFFGTFAMANVS